MKYDVINFDMYDSTNPKYLLRKKTSQLNKFNEGYSFITAFILKKYIIIMG